MTRLSRSGASWTPEEIEQVARMYDSGASYGEIADCAQRTVAAIEYEVARIKRRRRMFG